MTFNERAARIIPGGAHTYSKGRDQFPANVPQAFVRGKGGRVWDLDGREFVDWGMGINNVLIGHADRSRSGPEAGVLQLVGPSGVVEEMGGRQRDVDIARLTDGFAVIERLQHG